MTVDFQDNFWSEKQAGFDVLYQNFKCGSTSGRELSEFIKTRSTLEESNYNLLIKLSRKTTNQQLGTFQPLWQLLKLSTEKISSLHMQTLQRLQQLIKEINKYCEDHYKKQKQIKNEENATIDAMNDLKDTIAALTKAKEFYFGKALEIDRLKKENASQKDIEKAEGRMNKACTEYKVMIEKYNKIKDDYEKKFCMSCKHFQRLEEDHLKQMKDYLASYSHILESGHALVGQVYKEFQGNCHDTTIDVLLDKFIKARGTGNARLKDIQFEEANASNIKVNLSSLSQSSSSTLSKQSFSMKERTVSTDLLDLMNPPNMNRMSMHRSNNSLAETNAYSTDLSLFQVPITALQPTQQQQSTSNTIQGCKLDQHQARAYMQALRQRQYRVKGRAGSRGSSESVASRYALSLVDLFASSSIPRECPRPLDGIASLPLTSGPSVLNPTDHAYLLACLNPSTSTTNSNTIDKSYLETSSNTAEVSQQAPSTMKTSPGLSTASRTSKWFSRHRKDKTKDKKNKTSDTDSIGSKTDLPENGTSSKVEGCYIDEEGFTVRPQDNNNDKEDDDFYSSSDSEDEGKEKKIFVKINPLNGTSNMSTSVDQLIASAGALTLAPMGPSRRHNLSTNPSPTMNDNTIKRSASVVQSAFKTEGEGDLFATLGTAKPGGFDPFANPVKVAPTSTSTLPAPPTQSSQPDRYAALSELFSSTNSTPSTTIPENEVVPNLLASVPPLPPKSSVETTTTTPAPFSIPSNLLSKSLSSSTMLASSSNTFSVYKPLSKSLATSSFYGGSNGMMSRTDSINSLSSDLRMTPISYSSSRDSSPLTIGMSDTVPIAIAFQESVGAAFKGADEKLCKTHIIGCFKVAFSVGIIQVFANNPHIAQLSFRIKNTKRLARIILQNEFVAQVEANEDDNVYDMNMSALQAYLKRQYEQNPHSRYYNLDLLKYQVNTVSGVKDAPLHLAAHWKCEPSATNLKIDYKFNASAFAGFTGQSLKAVNFTANIDGNVLNMHSQPEGRWDSNTNQATWRFNEISQFVENAGLGSIKAKFDLSNGPSCPSSVYVQFSGQDTIFSGLEFELVGTGYRLSLIKKQFSSGRYYCEPKT